MKHWNRTLPFKIICFIMCVVSLCITAASIAGAAFMIMGGFYVLPKEYMVESLYSSMLRSESNNIIWHHLDDEEYHYYSVYDYDTDITNIRYNVVSPSGKIIGSNTEDKSFDYVFKWVHYKNEEGNYTEVEPYYENAENQENADIFTVNMSVDTDFHVKDEYFFFGLLYDIAYSLLYWIYPIGLLSLGLCIACFILLMCSSGRKPNSEELHPGPLYRVPIDLLISIPVLGIFSLLYLIFDIWYAEEIVLTIITGAIIFVSVIILLGLCMSVAARIKGATLLKNTVAWITVKLIGRTLRWLFKGFATVIRAIPLIWRTILFLFANLVLDLVFMIMVYNYQEVGFFLWTVKALHIIPIIIYGAIMLRRLEKGGKAISKGNLSYKINTIGMLWDFRRHGENLNSISSAMAVAVDERLQSERMKTELITNVSHDIKTPITSIINYSSLIAENDCNCESHREYSMVLIRKSEHLKRLLDDLVEISKATTGNLDVLLTPCEAGVLLSQAAGEFEERCALQDLELICTSPDESFHILADSRRIWRIFENLLGNAAKYSLPGSRVYLSLERKGRNAVFTLKNTSRTPLNITPEELTARFVRGDSSRTTEGNGLGLSIAKSLTELQGGKMDILIDGDLFKVTLTFPTV